jgi:hypothetical protein
MAVKECYRNELDIKYTERKKNKQSFFEWNQGPYFSFDEGHTFYDTPNGYEKWEMALKVINIACKIDAATPTIYDKNKITPEFSTDEFRDAFSIIKLCNLLLMDGIAINQTNIDALNNILELEDLFERISNQHTSIKPSQQIIKLKQTFGKSKRRPDLIKLNRAVLETFYEQDCPKSQDKSIVEGIVNFTIYKPDEEHKFLTAVNNYELSQTEFVKFLKTGLLNERAQHKSE